MTIKRHLLRVHLGMAGMALMAASIVVWSHDLGTAIRFFLLTLVVSQASLVAATWRAYLSPKADGDDSERC